MSEITRYKLTWLAFAAIPISSVLAGAFISPVWLTPWALSVLGGGYMVARS